MNLSVREIIDKATWERFLAQCPEKTFLHAWQWGVFRQQLGDQIWRWGVYAGDELVAVAFVAKVTARRGTFLMVPHGPIGKYKVGMSSAQARASIKYQVLKELVVSLQELAKKEGASFIRLAPLWERNAENTKLLTDCGFRRAPIHMHPEVTWELDITPSEDDLLMGMRKTTRYLIRQAHKDQAITIEQSTNKTGVEMFNKLYAETATRHTFVPFSLEYLGGEFAAFAPENNLVLFLGKYKGEPVSAAMVIYWHEHAFYHQGASLLKYAKMPVSYLVQWEAIQEAKRRGCRTYNFWGIAPTIESKDDLKKSRHPWAGLTLFKMGFGGAKKEYVFTHDLPLSWKYWINYSIERLRKRKRNL